MAAPKPQSEADRLRQAGERIVDAADRWEIDHRSITVRQRLHDDIETAAADARAVVRGSGGR